MPPPAGSVLLLIDLQQAIDHPSWGVRNHPEAERRGAELLAAWRVAGRRLIHVRHDSVEPNSTYRPGQPGHQFKPEFEPAAAEPVIAKTTCSAFVRTDLEAMLDRWQARDLLVFGVITNNSVETTVRHAACLGFRVWLVQDACFTFGRNSLDGQAWAAAKVHAMSLANLQGEYCQVIDSADVMASLTESGLDPSYR